MNATTTTTTTTNTSLVQIHRELTELQHTLKCPLCRYTLHNPSMLPCLHAFCSNCILTYIQSQTTNNNNSNNSNSNSNSSRGCTCPICKQGCYTHRSVRESRSLSNIVRSFKECVQAFGCAPVRYEEEYVDMTQLPPEEQVLLSSSSSPSSSDLNAAIDENRIHDKTIRKHEKGSQNYTDTLTTKSSTRAKRSRLSRCHEHLMVSRAMQNALLVDAQNQQLEQKQENKLERVAKEIEKVVRYDEKALVEAAVQRRKSLPDYSSTVTKGSTPTASSESTTTTLTAVATESLSALEGARAAIQQDNNIVQTSRANSSKASSIILEEGATIATPLAHNVKDGEFKFPLSTTHATNQDNEYEAKNKNNNHNYMETEVVNTNTLNPLKHITTSRVNDGTFKGIDPTQQETVLNNNKTSTNSMNITTPAILDDDITNTKKKISTSVTSSIIEMFHIGDVVQVQDRTWPGINKPGGVARIVNIRSLMKEEAKSVAKLLYDVQYVLGGREKGIEGEYIRPSHNSIGSNDRCSQRKRQAKKSSAPVTSAYVNSEKENCGVNVKMSSGKKNANGNSKKETKKRKILIKEAETPCSVVKVKPITLIGDIEAAEEYYAERVSSHIQQGTINILTSGLMKGDNADDGIGGLLQLFVSEMRQNIGVKVKISNSANPSKVTVCLAALSHKPELASLGIAKMRTLKSMRASLAGVPIVTEDWILECIEQSCIINPKERHCVKTLQTKHARWMEQNNDKSNNIRAHNGVLRIAANLRKSQMISKTKKDESTLKLLRNFMVLPCGIWKKGYGPKLNDVKTLIKDTGGQLFESSITFINAIESKTSSSSPNKILLICDESTNNKDNGIDNNLLEKFRDLCSNTDSKDSILIVNSSFLFDCISCGEVLDSCNYPPASPSANSIWSLCQTSKT